MVYQPWPTSGGKWLEWVVGSLRFNWRLWSSF